MRMLIALLTLSVGGYLANTAQAQNLVAESRTPSDSPIYEGTDGRWVVSVRNEGGAGAAFTDGEVLLSVTFPDGVEPVSVGLGSGGGFGGDVACATSGQDVLCLADGPFTLSAGGDLNFSVSGRPTMAGSYDAPTGPLCLADPGNVVAETNEADNECVSTAEPLVVRALPAGLQEDWLLVNQWDNLARRYSTTSNTILGTELVLGPDDEPYHSLGEIVRHPQTGELYVFQRPYQTRAFSMGIYTPGAGVAPIGDTGLSLYDAAFTGDGTLYALGRDGNLYTIDTASAAPTPRCATGLSANEVGSQQGAHGALAWDENEGLVALGDGELLFIDTTALPPDPSQDCVVRVVEKSIDQDQYWAAEVIDGRLYMIDNGEMLSYVAWDGAVGELFEVPNGTHGMIAYAPQLPAPTGRCPAELYIASTAYFATSTSLFAFDPEAGALDYIRELPFNNIRGLEIDPRNGDLLIADDGIPGTLYRVAPCDADDEPTPLATLGLPDADAEARALDLGLDGILHLIKDGLTLGVVDLDTGVETLIADIQRRAVALAVHDGEAIVPDWSEERELSTGLAFYDLADVAGGPTRTLPLQYGPGLEAGQERKLESLEVGPDGTPLYAILARTGLISSLNTNKARANALVRIDAAGRVEHLADLPNSALHLARRPTTLVTDGFEAGIDGCYFDGSVWFDWSFGTNTVSNTTVFGDDARPLYGYSDSQCLTLVGPLGSVAHADDPAEALDRCLSLDNGSAAVELIDDPNGQPSVGDFYRCVP